MAVDSCHLSLLFSRAQFDYSGTWPVASTVTDGDPFPGRNVHPLDSFQTIPCV